MPCGGYDYLDLYPYLLGQPPPFHLYSPRLYQQQMHTLVTWKILGIRWGMRDFQQSFSEACCRGDYFKNNFETIWIQRPCSTRYFAGPASELCLCSFFCFFSSFIFRIRHLIFLWVEIWVHWTFLHLTLLLSEVTLYLFPCLNLGHPGREIQGAYEEGKGKWVMRLTVTISECFLMIVPPPENQRIWWNGTRGFLWSRSTVSVFALRTGVAWIWVIWALQTGGRIWEHWR